ncbi:hypothetical protein FRC07_001008 [Ceratobasidium sp. 392]|nr:hypothetical protein FRC07_001008 [Ceratobasidium sp. 392]
MSPAHSSSIILPGSFVPSLNTVLGSSGGRSQVPYEHAIDFTNGWSHEDCPTRRWYMAQPSTKFSCLQYRKDIRPSYFYHEFIVAELDNGTFCRFDRRGDPNGRGEAIGQKGIKAEDTVQVLDSEFRELEQTSKLLLKVHFPQKQDLITILATCHGIQIDERAGRYMFTRFNCYFFSWTILITTARHMVDWGIIVREPKLWDELVTSCITQSTSSCDKPKVDAGSILDRVLKTNEPAEDMPPFVGAAYLIETLRKSLNDARPDIGTTLDELVLESAVDKTVRELSSERLRNAAQQAAKKHAYHAARDAGLEAIVETMWQRVFSDPHAGKAWEAASRDTEKKIRDAAEEAANVSLGEALEGDGWQDAWNKVWGSEDAYGLISSRAKTAWKDAWTNASLRNETYIRRISDGVAKYVMGHLPDSTPDMLKVEKQNQFTFGSTEASNKFLQEYLRGRIERHCKTVHTTQLAEFDEAMHRVWKSCMSFSAD